MTSQTKPVSASFHSRRFDEISERYPPEDVRAYLTMQRRWIRRVTQMQHLTPIQRCAVLFIGSFMTPSTPFCFAGMHYICKCVGCERTSVNRAVTQLEQDGYLKVDRQKRGGNVYRISFPI
ncbi:hypothetical protein HGP16_25340 [Rhizobium sp. P40RR-XXII]|uniref:helix-turn-helix domain-containing protein n=1 Tax=Rhizobium sp. P40RR-XXII TaxID=2726739 RepID=UPI001456C9B4|nr:helix-turn-helix domain-containing protein [Rhizobium sp. P40RR-XXII]NLS19867.1 hypothetical protein [Rhizobium sp. P40RR-XXII]